MEPIISIGMPVYNCERTLELAIRSLLLQTFTSWELILIDDGSTDGTLRVAQQLSDPRIRIYADGKNQGLPARLNQAIRMSRGTYFARMDGDDIAYPQRFERQVAYLEEHPKVDLVGTGVVTFGQGGISLGKRPFPETHEDIVKEAFFNVFPMIHPTFVGHIKWFLRFLYDEDAIKFQDQALLLRSYRNSRFANVPEILLGYREESLDLKKLLNTRYYKILFSCREAIRQRHPGIAMKVVILQVIKSIIEIFAVTTGLNYCLLRHRARPISAEEWQQWQNVWNLVNQEVCFESTPDPR